MSISKLVTFDEFSPEIAPDEYLAIIERQREQLYTNAAALDEAGSPVSVDDYILEGAKIYNAVLAEA